jgi:GNAT superfamily N-acetyltransferase
LKTLNYQVIKSPKEPDFRAVLEIYATAFPKNEQQSQETLENRLRSGQETLIVAKIEGNIAAFAFLFGLKATDFLLVDYFAVAENYRNQGVGSVFFKYLCHWASVRSIKLLLEVDDPAFGSEPEQKRVAFYEKNGAKKISGIPYILPPLDGTVPTNQILMAANQVDDLILIEKIKLVICLYQQLYERSLGDPYLSQILGNIR